MLLFSPQHEEKELRLFDPVCFFKMLVMASES